MLTLTIASPHVYADDDDNQPAPARPAMNLRLPGYHPVRTTGFVIPPGAAPEAGPPIRGSPSKVKGFPKPVCSITNGSPSGIVSVAGGQLIEDWYTGDLWFYNPVTKSCSFVQTPPLAASGEGYWGLAVKRGLVAAITWNQTIGPGVWLCTYFPSLRNCYRDPGSTLIPIPSSFCATMTTHYCIPDGLAFDPSKNLWYVDPDNGVEVELTAASQYTQVGTVISYSRAPVLGIVIDAAGNHWVVDTACVGDLFENGVYLGSVGDDLEAVTISSHNPSHTSDLYATISNFCNNFPAPYIADLNTFRVLPFPYGSGADDMPGISTVLYFTDISFNYVWLTKDTVD